MAIDLTAEQGQMWKKLSTPAKPPQVAGYSAYGSYGVAIGYKAQANGNNSIAIGAGCTAQPLFISTNG